MALVPRFHACRIYQSEMTNGVQCNGNSMMISLRPKVEVAGCCSFVRRQQDLRWDFPGLKRGRQVTVAASPPAEDTTVLTEPLTKKDLVDYLASGCKQKEQWRIGTEHEKFGFEVETLRPISYEQIAALLNGIAERFEWDKIMEENHVIGLKQGKQSISLEPGGQFELSGAPLETLHQTCAEVNSHLYQVKAVAEEMGIGFLGIGFQPKLPLKDIPIMPKGRYEIMRNYMPKVGSLGLDMMFRTCTVQVNLDFSSESDMIRKFRASLALQPIATAIFANSPFTEGKPNGFLSMRSHIWTDTDNDRAGMLPFVFDDSFGMHPLQDRRKRMTWAVAIAILLLEYYRSSYRRIPRMTSSFIGDKWVGEMLAGHPIRFSNIFRMTAPIFIDLLHELSRNHHLQGSSRTTTREVLAITLYMLSQNESVRGAMERFQHSSETISRYFSKGLQALVSLATQIIKPTDTSFANIPEQIANDSRYMPYFKNCIGAIDDTHVDVRLPSHEKIAYIGRSGTTTQNVMAVCDFNMCFTFVMAGWEGSAHDSRLFSYATKNRTQCFPHPPPGKYYLVDAGYPMLRGYLKPYPDTRYHIPDFERASGNIRGKKEMFNKRHSALRGVIERTFGVWKNKWVILRDVILFIS